MTEANLRLTLAIVGAGVGIGALVANTVAHVRRERQKAAEGRH